MEAIVVFNTITKLFDLILEVNCSKETISTSKNYGHWQYHLNRGTLAKSVAKYGITSFVYQGFTPSDLPTSTEPSPKPFAHSPAISWFSTESLYDSFAKKRGRPRKYLPKISGVTVHKVSDDEIVFRSVSPKERSDVERNFRMFQKSMSVKEALDEISLKFSIPYRQAYEIVLSHI